MNIKSIEHTVKIWLENTACLGTDAIWPRLNCDTTYVEMATASIMNQIKEELEKDKQNECTKI